MRFLDNFSAGTRGSSSAEHFLRTGDYAVLFLHRQHSLQPFSRHYSHSTNPFLDLLEVVDSASGVPVLPLDSFPEESQTGADGELAAPSPSLGATRPLFPHVPPVVTGSQPPSRTSSSQALHAAGLVKPEEVERHEVRIAQRHLPPMLSLLKSYQLVKSLGILHSIPFTTVEDYLFLLRGVSRVMGLAKDGKGHALGRRGMYYLAAAVSDFYIPTQRMSEHKIQSGKGSLTIEMDQVPKVLKHVVDEWSNDGFIVSFKVGLGLRRALWD